MNLHTIIGIALGLYYGSFVISALFELPRLHTYLAASCVGAATVAYGFYVHQWTVVREQLVRWQYLILTFLSIVGISYLVNRDAYNFSLTLKVVGYASVFAVSSMVALVAGRQSATACMQTYLVCLLLAMGLTLVVNNTNSHNHRLLGPSQNEDSQGVGLHHNEVGLLGMTAAVLAATGGWRLVLVVAPPALYTAFLAGSRGSIMGVVLALVVFVVAKGFLARSARREFSEVTVRGLTVLAGGLLAVLMMGTFAGDFITDDVLHLHSENRGLSSGFTGRLDTWQEMFDKWKQSPVVGRGYGIVRGEARDLGMTADGGYLLLTSELGLAGLLLFLFLIFRTFRTSWAEVTSNGSDESIAILVFLTAFCFINIFESRFVGTGSIGLGIFVYLGSLCVLDPHPKLLEAHQLTAHQMFRVASRQNHSSSL